jgi:hypothetical protein
MKMYRDYTITEVITQKVKKTKSDKFAFNITAKYYPDITGGQYNSPTSMRFYSDKKGWIYTRWEE